MSILDNVKEVVGLVQKVDNIDLLRQILGLQGEVMQLWEDNNSLKAEVKRLKEQMSYAGQLEFRRNGYWIPKGENKEEEGPFCSVCWDVDRTLVRMTHEDGFGIMCRYCAQARSTRKR